MNNGRAIRRLAMLVLLCAVGHLHGATDYHSHVNRYGRMDWWHGEKQVKEIGYNTTLITKHSVRFIEEHRDKPFFLFVSHSAIHFPWMTPDDKPHQVEGRRYESSLAKLGPHAKGPVQPIVQRMIEEGQDCRDVVTQLSACKSALDRVGYRLVAAGLRHCATPAPDADADSMLDPDELERLFMKLS